MGSRVVSERHLEARKVRTLLRVSLTMAFRPLVDSAGRIRGRPLRTIALSYAIYGVLFALNIDLFADRRSFIIALLSAVLAISMIAILPDTAEALQRRTEIIGSKPITAMTAAVAGSIQILVISSLIVSMLVIPGLVQAVRHLDLRLPGALALMAIAILAAHALSMAYLGLLSLLTRWLRFERLRVAAQILLTTTMVAASLIAMIPRALLVAQPLGKISFEDLGWVVRAFPPAWLADFVLDGSSRAAWLERGLVLAGILLAHAAYARLATDEAGARLHEHLLQPAAAKGRAPWTVAFLRAIRAGRWLFDRRSLAITTLILTESSREDGARARLVPLRLTLVVLLGLDLMARGAPLPGLPTSILGVLLVIEGIRAAKQSSHPVASWILSSAPISPRQVVSAIRVSVLLGYFSFPLALSTIAYFAHASTPLALSLTASSALEAHAAVSIVFGIDPAWPLSVEQQRYAPILGRLGVAMLFGFVGAIRTILVLDARIGPYYLCGLVLAAFLLSRWSERRFESRLSSSL
jgi:hypothetical protein